MSAPETSVASGEQGASAPPGRIRVRRVVRPAAPTEPTADRHSEVRRVVRTRLAAEPKAADVPAPARVPAASAPIAPPSWKGAVLMLLVVIGLALLGFQLTRGASSAGVADVGDRALVSERARAAVQTVINLKPDTVDESLSALFAAGTPELERNFGASATELKKVLSDGGVYLTGYVRNVAIISLEEDRAEVAVTAAGAVVETESRTQAPRKYWVQVSLVRDDDIWRIEQIRLDP